MIILKTQAIKETSRNLVTQSSNPSSGIYVGATSGLAGMRTNLAFVEAVREVVGPDIDIRPLEKLGCTLYD